MLLFSLTILSCCHTSFVLPHFFYSYFAVSGIFSTLLPLLCLPSLTARCSTVFKFWPKTPLSQILLHSTKVFISLLGLQSIYLLLLSSFHKKKKSCSTTIMERSPGGRHGNLLLYSFLENPVNREAWWATVHGAVKSRTWLKRLSKHNCEGGMRTQKREVQRSFFSTL